MTRTALGLFVARRLALTVGLLVLLSFVVFSLLYISPGSAEHALVGNREVAPEVLANIRAKYHLDRPFLAQYWLWARDVAHLDLGTSIRSRVPVTTLLRNSFAVTASLGIYAFVIAVGFGIPLGIVAALKRRRTGDNAIVGLSVLASSTPVFVSGIAVLYLFAVVLKIFPAFGAGAGVLDRLWHLTLPALTLGMAVTALVVKLTRAAMIQALEQDYVAFARACGVPMRRVLIRYAFRNALVPVITAGGLVLAVVLGGSVITEVTFNLPGLGALLVEAVNGKDYPLVQGLAMLIATLVVLVNLVVDVLYTVVDPRIVFGSACS